MYLTEKNGVPNPGPGEPVGPVPCGHCPALPRPVLLHVCLRPAPLKMHQVRCELQYIEHFST